MHRTENRLPWPRGSVTDFSTSAASIERKEFEIHFCSGSVGLLGGGLEGVDLGFFSTAVLGAFTH